jgi:hypothetical protein
MSLIDRVKAAQNINVQHQHQQSRERLEAAILAKAAAGYQELSINHYLDSNIHSRSLIFDAARAIGNEPGFKFHARFVGKAGSHCCFGEEYSYVISWE